MKTRSHALVLPLIAILSLMAAAAGGADQTSAQTIIRGIYCDPGPALNNSLWAPYGAGYEIDDQVKHGGKASFRCANESPTDAHGAVQMIQLDQKEPRPIIISGWAKLDGVTGHADYHCSVYLDLRLKDGKSWPMKIAAFDPAKSGWQHAEEKYTPPAPIDSARVYVFLRERKGTAWFDDLYVGEDLGNGKRTPNLLKDPGLEGATPGGNTLRDAFFAKLKSIGCDAFHIYRSVPWDKVMPDDPSAPVGDLPKIDPHDPLLDFVQDAHRRGFKVWVTVGLGYPKMENAQSKWFPFWPCVNNKWGEGYTRAIAYFAQYGFDGIGMVPDEWNYDTSRVERFANSSDPKVAAFYKHIPAQCDCDVCRTEFKQRTGHAYPDVRHLWSSDDPVWGEYAQFRYDSTTAWIRRSVEAAKKINPNIVTDTMICVLPVCSDKRLATGAAWDEIGAQSGLDCLQTDPYIFLHNYLGDSTHYYPTETTIHLAAANWKGRAGVTLEACRLRDTYREKQPAEVYGAALSCLVHGAREFFWWHLNYLEGREKWVDGEKASARVAAFYKVVQGMDADLRDLKQPGDILVLYSRNSEDTWQRLAKGDLLPRLMGDQPDPRRGFLAHKNVLYWLLRRGYPFETTFVDHPDPAKLQAAKVVLMPFPFALSQAQVATVRQLAADGKTVVLMSELSPLDELGQPLPQPRLASLFGSQTIDTHKSGVAKATVGKGKVLFFGGDFAINLFAPVAPQKDPTAFVPLADFDAGRTSQLEQTIRTALGRQVSLFAAQPNRDVEATVADGARGRLLLLINWDWTRPTKVALNRAALGNPTEVAGYAILNNATVNPVSERCSGASLSIDLQPQEARLLRLSR